MKNKKEVKKPKPCACKKSCHKDKDRELLEKAQKEAHEFKNKYLMALAESENTRKRMQKEKQNLVKHVVADAILEFLHPIDHLENALKSTENLSEELKNWAAGFKMILKQFQDALVNQNIMPIDAIGKKFDPHLHDAVETIETKEHPDHTIIKEFVKGYKMGDKIIRPSRVVVAQAPKKSSKKNNNPEVKHDKKEI